MAARTLYPAPVKVAVNTSARAVKTTRPAKLEGLRPFRLRLFDAPEFRMRNGFPVEVPDIDVRQAHLASASGERLASRPGARELQTSANARWVADPDFYRDVDFHWLPIYSDLGSVSFDSAPVLGPTLIEDYTYAIDNERFTARALNFDRDSSQHMWSQVDALTGSAGFTVIMVCTMNSAFGNTDGAGYSGLFCSGQPTTGSGTLDEYVENAFQVQLVNNTIRIVTDEQTSPALQIAGLMSSTAPFYLALALGRPSSVVYAGRGTRGLQRVVVRTGTDDLAFQGSFVLGRSYGDTLHTADMAVLDFGLYADRLTSDQVREEIALLSSVYGGES